MGRASLLVLVDDVSFIHAFFGEYCNQHSKIDCEILSRNEMKNTDLKSLIEKDEEENIAHGIYVAVFCFFTIALSVGAFAWFIVSKIFA